MAAPSYGAITASCAAENLSRLFGIGAGDTGRSWIARHVTAWYAVGISVRFFRRFVPLSRFAPSPSAPHVFPSSVKSLACGAGFAQLVATLVAGFSFASAAAAVGTTFTYRASAQPSRLSSVWTWRY